MVSVSSPEDPSTTHSPTLDRTALLRTIVVVVLAGLLLFVSWNAIQGDVEQSSVAAVPTPTPTDNEGLASWPAGPLAGLAPMVTSGQLVDPTGCVQAASSEAIALATTDGFSIFLFADSSADITATWQDDDGRLTHDVPGTYFDHEFTTGRVTLSAPLPIGNAEVTIRAQSGPLRVCGVDT